MPSEDDDDSSVISVVRLKSELPVKRRRAKKIKIPHRDPSIVIPGRKIVYITADKTTCAKCTCFPKEDPYVKPKKLNPCQMSPLTLYELAADIVDQFKYPEPFDWNEDQVADWLGTVVGLPRYKECIYDNHINGRRLLMLEDPSVLPEINIHDFEHIRMITSAISKLFTQDYIRFLRSIGLPFRKPLSHCTGFKSRTGPSWGIRQNWTRSDILRWMKILMPAPVYMNHWDLVWYETPDFPKVLLARIPRPDKREIIPRYIKPREYCNEYTTPRRFRLQSNIPEESQLIWMEHRPGSPSRQEEISDRERAKKKVKKNEIDRLMPKRVSLTGLSGKQLILARRKMPAKKFLKS